MIKRILIITVTVLIAISGFLIGFFSVGCMSVYAINDDVLWQPLNSESELVTAFQYYCKSRDVTIEGSVADAVTTATTGAFNGICNKLGIDITYLQADIKKSTDSNGNLQFLFNESGIAAYNRIFAQFLQDNELQVGDTEQVDLFNGHYYTYDNHTALCFEGSLSDSWGPVSNITVFGSSYFYDTQQLINLYNAGNTSVLVEYSDNTKFNWQLVKTEAHTSSTNDYVQYAFGGGSYGNVAFYYKGIDNRTTVDCYGYPIVIYQNGKYYANRIIFNNLNNKFRRQLAIGSGTLIDLTNNDDYGNTTVIIVATNINNNVYEGDTIINNDGDTIINPEPTPTPEPNNPNDIIHNVPETPITPNPDGGWDIDLPDIDIPNLPIGNLSEKFPFSIPWDLVAFYAMLDAEPEAPRFNGTMDLTLVQWNYDIDLSPFDSAAALCRKLQFGLFVVGLIVASRSIIRG